ncbi:MAG: type I-F CRISPR-associated protein Csy1 [Alphaproteobacteria bacterium]
MGSIIQSWKIRKHDSGWSDSESCSNLPVYQKIWLDDIRVEERENSQDWLDKVIEELSRWIRNTYEKLHISSSIKLGDDELLHIKNIIRDNKEALL